MTHIHLKTLENESSKKLKGTGFGKKDSLKSVKNLKFYGLHDVTTHTWFSKQFGNCWLSFFWTCLIFLLMFEHLLMNRIFQCLALNLLILIIAYFHWPQLVFCLQDFEDQVQHLRKFENREFGLQNVHGIPQSWNHWILGVIWSYMVKFCHSYSK